MVNESQAISNIMNFNNSTNTFNSLNKSGTKMSNKIILDMPINIDLDKNDSDKSREEIESSSENIINKANRQIKIKIGEKNENITKFDKLASFINKLNDDEFSKNRKSICDINYNNNSHIKLPNESENQKDEKLLNQMIDNIALHIGNQANANSSLKENEENENMESNINDLNNYMRISDNFENKNITGSIMYINSIFDKNIHMKNRNENNNNNLYSRYNDNNDNNDNNNNCEELEIDTPNNDEDFIGNLENIKINVNLRKNSNQKEDTETIDNNNEENEYGSQNEEKFYKPLDRYENKFNLEQINPF